MANMIQTYSITDYGKTSVNVRNIELEPFGKTTGQSIVLTEHLVQDKILVPNIARGDIVEVDMNKKQIIKKLYPAGTYDYMVITRSTGPFIWAIGPKFGKQTIRDNFASDCEVKRDDEVLVQKLPERKHCHPEGYFIMFNLTVARNIRRHMEKYANKVY